MKTMTQKFMLIDVNRNSHSYIFTSEHVTIENFKKMISEIKFINVRDLNGNDCVLATDKIVVFYINGDSYTNPF